MARPTLADFEHKALNIPEVRKEYENLSLPYQIKKEMIEQPQGWKQLTYDNLIT